MTDWSDVVARARGMAAHLLGREALRGLAGAHDLEELGTRLAAAGYGVLPEEARSNPVVVERFSRRAAAARLNRLAQWCGRRATLLAPLFDDEDRRSLRAITRGVVASAPGEQLTSGLLPTPALPERALAELAARHSLSEVAALLVAWGHPFGAPMLAQAERPHPDLFAVQLAVDRVFAARAVDAAGRAGSPLLDYVRLQIDAANLWSARALARGEVERSPDALYLDGGTVIHRRDFEHVARLTGAAAADELARLVGGTPLAELTGAATSATGGTAIPRDEDLLLAITIRSLRRAARERPLGLGVIVHYVLRLRAELRDIARIVWGVRLGIPRGRLESGLVTP